MKRDAFIESLLSETASARQRSAGNPEAIRGVIFLYLNHAYEGGLEPDRICDLLGVAQDNVLKRAGLCPQDETAVMDAYEVLDPILEQQYRPGNQTS